MKSLCIGYISQTFGLGGAETFVSELLEELATRKHRIRAYTNHRSFQNLLQARHIAVTSIPVAIDIIGDWKGLLKAAVLLPFVWCMYGVLVWQERGADLILISGFAEKLPVSWWAQVFGVPVVWIEFSPLASVLSKFLGIPRLWYRLAARYPVRVITASQHSKRGLVSEGRLAANQMTVIPCGRALTNFTVDKLPGQPEIICISRMEEGKGQDLLVQIFALVHKEIPRAHLTLVGEGTFLPKVQQLVSALQLTQAVTFTGRVSDALKVLAAGRVCAVPSVWSLEGFGLVACEGMALGKPVVAFDHGPINEIIIHNKTGFLAPDGDVQQFAENIIRVLQDKALAQRLGQAGLQHFRSHYTIRQVAKQYDMLFQQLCQ